jgi:hypothetical protein
MNGAKEFKVPSHVHQEFYCSICDSCVIDSNDPSTGKFFYAFGHRWMPNWRVRLEDATPKDAIGDYHMVIWAVCQDCLGKE